MKKLLSVLAVAALVTSAFAFTNYNKIATFCIKNKATGLDCRVIRNVMIDPDGANFQHWPLAPGKWDGNEARCTNASPVTDCITPVTLAIN